MGRSWGESRLDERAELKRDLASGVDVAGTYVDCGGWGWRFEHN